MKVLAVIIVATTTLAFATPAFGDVPFFNAVCPGGIDVHADQGGPIYINGKQARLKRSNSNYYEARGEGVVISLSVNPDGTPSVSYTGRHGANGICQITDRGSGGDSGSAAAGAAPISRGNMPAYCRGEVSSLYGARPAYVKTGKIVKAKDGSLSISGTVDKGDEGIKKFMCRFDSKRNFIDVMAMTSDGE